MEALEKTLAELTGEGRSTRSAATGSRRGKQKAKSG
jgi:hypothetical protein